MAAAKRFSTAPVTAPTAGEAIPAANGPAMRGDVETPRRQEAETPRRPDVTTSTMQTDTAARIAFTWRLTADQADQLDTLVMRLRRRLGRGRLDKAAVLLALVQLADDSDDVATALLARLRRQDV